MRKLLILGLTIFSLVACKENVTKKINKDNLEVAKQRDYKINDGAAAITFSKTEHDFGTINEGDVVETIFNFVRYQNGLENQFLLVDQVK